MRAVHRLGPLLLVALLAAVALVYSPGLSGGFLFDDFHNIVTNERLHVERLDGESLSSAVAAYRGVYGRPLATLTFAFDFYVGGKDAYAFKVTNLLVHLLNTLLVYVLARRLATLTFDTAGEMRSARLFGTAVALAWAVHPLQVSTVLYIVQRMEMLAATFMLLSVLAWIRGRTRQLAGNPGFGWLLGAALLAAIGLLSKESAVLAALFVLTVEATIFRFGAADPVVSRRLKLVFAAAAAVAVALVFAVLIPRYASPESFASRDFTMGERLLTQLRIVPMYLGQIVLPFPGRMTFYYDDFALSTGLFAPWTTAAGAASLLAMGFAAWKMRVSWPLVSLGLLWFLAGHVLTSGPFNLELVFEHRNYLPMFGIVLALAELVRRIPMRDGPALKAFAVAVVFVFLAALATIRTATWGNPLVLAADLAERNPQSARAGSDLATLYFSIAGNDVDSPYFAMALAEFDRASRLPNASPLPESSLILMAASAGLEADPAWWDRLIEKLRTQPIGVQQTIAVGGMRDRYAEGFKIDKHRLGEATKVLLSRQRWPGWMYADFGEFAFTELGDQALAEQMFVAAVDANPADIAFSRRVVENLIADGRTGVLQAVLGRLRAHGTEEQVLSK